jgi:exosortase
VDNPVSSIAGTRAQHKPSPKRQWREVGLHDRVKIAIVALLFCFLFRNVIYNIVYRWCNDSTWSHGFLIPFFSLYFLYQQRHEILAARPRPNYLGLAFLVFAILVFVLNTISPSGYAYLRRVSMIAALGAIVLFLGGWGLVRYTWLPIGFLVFAVPLPERFYRGVSSPMRQWAATVAAALLNLLDEVQATARGVLIEVVHRGEPVDPPLNVADACSGMRLLTAFLALGVAMAFLHYRPIWQRVVLLVSTVPIAILCNIVRVTVTGFIYVLIDPEYTQGLYHVGLGLAMLPLAFGLYGFLAWFMSSLFVDETEKVVVVRRND